MSPVVGNREEMTVQRVKKGKRTAEANCGVERQFKKETNGKKPVITF